MNVSNITGKSNIYPCNGNPLRDQKFVNHIEDYTHLQNINKTQIIGTTGIQFTEKQLQLLDIEMRCVYAKNDPCWGYINGKGIQCKCIEDRCPQIKICNPTFSLTQKNEWTMHKHTKTIYGSPEMQKKFYLVDLVSDEEMLRYISDPSGDAVEYSVLKEVQVDEKKQGRRLVIIGFEDTYFGDADNQLSPIWGYVDDSEDTGIMVRNRYGSTKEVIKSNTEKRTENASVDSLSAKSEKTAIDKKTDVLSQQMLDEEVYKEYENKIKNKLGDTYQLTELNKDIITKLSNKTNLNIILANKAEMAYVSSMLLKADINHNIESNCEEKSVTIWNSNSRKIVLTSNIVFVSTTFIEQGCNVSTEKTWKDLSKVSGINELSVSGREFFEFGNKDNKRWGCRNLYGATHLTICSEDFKLENGISGMEKIILVRDIKNYIILSSSAERLGVTTDKLWSSLDVLKSNDEISEFPRVISGLYLKTTEQGLEIQGIGHMKFDEY